MSSRFDSRAREGWIALRQCLRTRSDRVIVHEPRRLGSVALWPFSQVWHTATILGSHDPVAAADLVRLTSTLETFRRGAAYSERPSNSRRYYDDNAWIALAALESRDANYGRATAERLLDFLLEGTRDFGTHRLGVGWVEGGSTHNACSTGSTGLVAARLANLSAGRKADDLRHTAYGCMKFLTDLLTSSQGLICDHLRPDGTVDAALYSYNQGLAIGLLVTLDDIPAACDLADRAIAEFSGERLWTHPPAFNAILVRELLTLDQRAPDPRWRRFTDAYLDRVWDEARNPSSGLFDSGGIGHYDQGRVLDHAALVGALALRARGEGD